MSYVGTREEINAKNRAWYHKVGYSHHKVRNHKLRKERIKQWLIKYKKQLKCKTCGETHIATLDFHHIDPSEKEIEISRAINCGWSIKRITAELEKCDVLCCKCHRIFHFNNYDWTAPKEICELTEDQKPNYLGHHGNGIPKKPFDEIYEYTTCDHCGKTFAIMKKDISNHLKMRYKHTYCSLDCLHDSLRKIRKIFKVSNTTNQPIQQETS